ncbi:MAG TPA: DUF4911 domain-containing protein [Candidatus Cloacimonadota bacterium]|nr:DUF4911 domain-containing protein [Candidatus Cloacimonadota bacterium]HPT71634.1 DUF4911 domain-containing protein [Candidatus Cloacimonadota bacterium]
MQFEFKEHTQLQDGTHRFILQVEPATLVLVGFLLESFDGLFNYTTIDDKNSLLQVDFLNDSYEDGKRILDFMKEWGQKRLGNRK